MANQLPLGIRVIAPWFFSLHVSSYQHSWFSSIELFIPEAGCRCLWLTQFWTLPDICPHPLQQKLLPYFAFLRWFWSLPFTHVFFIALFFLISTTQFPWLLDVILTGGFCITTCNCVICFLKVMILIPPQPLLIWPRLSPQICPILTLSLTSCSYRLRVHDPQVIIQILQHISKLFLKSIKKVIPPMLLDSGILPM